MTDDPARGDARLLTGRDRVEVEHLIDAFGHLSDTRGQMAGMLQAMLGHVDAQAERIQALETALGRGLSFIGPDNYGVLEGDSWGKAIDGAMAALAGPERGGERT